MFQSENDSTVNRNDESVILIARVTLAERVNKTILFLFRIKNINDLDGIDDIDSDFDAATYPETKAVQHFRKVVEERQQQVILLENE